jgi:gamma-D-glutamyl-L-lysine dipeptidyl-peptidase
MVAFVPAVLLAASMVISTPVANMYAEPDEDSGVVSQAIYGTNVGVVERHGNWVKVRTPDDYTGWVSSGSVLDGGKPYGVEGRVAQVESLFAHVYHDPSVTKRRPLITVPFETRLEVTAEPDEDERRWIQVRLPDKRTGWIQRGDLTFEPRTHSIAETIELAKRFLGLPYTWGGTSSFGYDCSGYTQMLCRRRGVTIPRDAKPQAHWDGMEAVERKDLIPGDFIYFGPSLDKITHTGMYIGSGEFIHATAHQRPIVQISSLDEEHWDELFVAARRVK